MKRALVTGADGFVGSHLVEQLVKTGYSVRALACYNSFNDWGWLDSIEELERVEIVSGDIRDAQFCRSLCKNMDIVFHLAALIGIPYSYVAPGSYVETNIIGTLNICQAALDLGVGRIVHTSTSEVYGTAKYVPIDEKHPLQPQSPYSASKIGADSMAMSFYQSFQLPLTIARPFNTYGPRQSARAVIPTIITQIANGIDDIKLGDTSPTRDFNYVTDTCRGLMKLAECDAAIGEVVNIGSNKEISILDTLNLIKTAMNCESKSIIDEERLRPEGSEVHRLRCDNTKIVKLTGYESEVSLKQGIENCVAWYTNPENLKRFKANIYNV